MYAAVYIEVNLVSILILVLILARHLHTNDRQAASIAYNRVALCTLMVLVIDALWMLTDGKPGPGMAILNRILNVLFLFSTNLISYLWLQFILCRFHKAPRPHSWAGILIALPLVAILLMCVLSPWTHWLFEIDAGNAYHRGPLHPVQVLATYGYLVAATGYALLRALREKNAERRAEAFTLCSFAILPAIGGAISTFFYGLPTTWPCTALSLLMIYLDLQSHQISTDALTGLNNRRQFDRYLLSRVEEPHRDGTLYLLLIDIDDFKRINDTYGHPVGDQALMRTAGLLKRVCGERNGFLARYGGDEFAIVLECRDDSEIPSLRQALSAAFALFNASGKEPYALNISVGVGSYAPGDGETPAPLISRADQALYEAKRERRAAR